MRRLALAALVTAVLPGAAVAQRAVEVQLAPPFLRMQVGAETAILATAYSREGTPVEARLFWSSTNINVATVDSAGVVRGVAPGVAIVTAAPDSSARRRAGRVTVLVVGPGAPVTAGGPPPPPGFPGTAPPAMIDTAHGESCEDLTHGLRNPGRVCYDRRAMPRVTPTLEAPAACRRPVSPAVVAVRIGAHGEVLDVRNYRPSNCPAFQELAAAWLRDLAFSPARLGNEAVASWLAVVVMPRGQETWVTPMPMPVPAPRTPTASPPAPRKELPRPN